MMREKTNTLRWLVRALVLVAVILVLWWLLFAKKDNHLALGVDEAINTTPQQIQSIRDIGQWEFLSVSDEELVDTVRRGLFKNDELVRIYYGTLRLGVDMKQVKIKTQGDTAVVTMPHVGLLDNDFIDEARTKAFYESGRWSASDREALYRKARRQMIAHAMTPQNLQSAEDNADAQLRRMMRAMGYKTVIVRFEKQTP
jgi:hypothetical protein